jgi:Mrp family chromosome partitioning ATPase
MVDAARHLPRAEHVLVTTPSPLTEVVTRKTAALLGRLGQPILGLVVNLDRPGERGAVSRDLAARLGVPLLGRVGADAGYEAALGDPAGLRRTAVYRDVLQVADAVRAGRPAR